jgi:hypothetical protein
MGRREVVLGSAAVALAAVTGRVCGSEAKSECAEAGAR